ncbi:MAG TPA: hypothetical protein VK307_02415 [Thermoleophilaceae bacterium]|nr:hypothetical protein [Thermoleophilaceae bacterium]
MAADEISPITVLTPVRRWWGWWLLLHWPFAQRSELLKRPLLALSFIHAAHWGLLRRGAAVPYIVFQSNYDGPAPEYAETFAIAVPWRVRGMWSGGYGFPGPHPTNRFTEYVLGHAVDGPYHYYSAYPGGTVRTVRAALGLRRSFERFRQDTAGLDAEEFARAWSDFLTAEQHRL